MENPLRNEITGLIGGEEVVLRLGFAQMQAAEQLSGMGLISLSEKIVDGTVAIWADILALGLEGAQGRKPDQAWRKAESRKIAEAMERDGAGHYMVMAQNLVLRALAGPPKGQDGALDSAAGNESGNAPGA